MDHRRVCLRWYRCQTAKDLLKAQNAIYLYGWQRQLYYLGKLSDKNRYRPGYTHWIDANICLGAEVYYGIPSPTKVNLQDLEAYLIQQWDPKRNTLRPKPCLQYEIVHGGDVPKGFIPRPQRANRNSAHNRGGHH